MSEKALKRVQKKFRHAVIDTHAQCGDHTVIVQRDAIRDLAETLRDDPELSFEMLVDITAVDYLPRTPRFEVVYHFLSISQRQRLRVKVPLEESDLHIDTLADIYLAAEWGEREAYDMYGVIFDGHPDLRRILMYEEFEGFPLRKDYPLLGSQPRIDLLEEERPTTNMYQPNYGEYGPEKENR